MDEKETDKKQCAYCGKVLYGRTDKKFCNDSCRNTFNRQRVDRDALEAHANLPEIFKIIRRNYELLLSLGPIEADDILWLKDRDLVKEGLNPKFFTSVHAENGTIWKYCFERGWQDSENSDNNATWFIKDRPQQAEV